MGTGQVCPYMAGVPSCQGPRFRRAHHIWTSTNIDNWLIQSIQINVFISCRYYKVNKLHNFFFKVCTYTCTYINLSENKDFFFFDLILEICDFPHPNFNTTSLHERPLSSAFMAWTLWNNVIFFRMSFFSRSGSNWTITQNERWKRSANSAVNVVYPWTLSGVKNQISARALLPVPPQPFVLNRKASSALGQ